MVSICQHCKNEFKNNKILRKHLNNAKYCREIRDKRDIMVFIYSCEFCDICFDDFDILEEHIVNCSKKIDKLTFNKIEELEIKIKKLEQQVLENKNINIKINNNTQINNYLTIMNVLDISDHRIKNIIDTKLGQKGIANFAINNLLKDNDGKLTYICSDASRKVFQYKSDDGYINKDLNAHKLIDALVNNNLTIKTDEIAQNLWTNDDGTLDVRKQISLFPKISEVYILKNDNTVFKNELATHTSM